MEMGVDFQGEAVFLEEFFGDGGFHINVGSC